jgi:hypothetical protein
MSSDEALVEEAIMKVLVYSARPYDNKFLEAANQNEHELHFTVLARARSEIADVLNSCLGNGGHSLLCKESLMT